MSTITVGGHRERMIDCLARGAGHEFLNLAESYLTVCPEDSRMRLNAVSEYLKLGLVGPARDLLDGASLDESTSAELTSIRTSLASLPSSAVTWASLSKTFQHNLDSLSSRAVDVSLIEKEWASGHRQYQLFRDSAGTMYVRRRDESGHWQWIPFFGDHRIVDDARDMPNDSKALMPGPYLFEGLDLGWFFKRVYDATLNTFLGYSCALYVVEPDPVTLAVVLHLHAWPDVWSDRRVFLFVGAGCTERLRRTLELNINLPWPSWACTLGSFRPGCAPVEPPVAAVTVVEEGIAARRRTITDSLREIEKQYAERDAAFWAKRFDDALSGQGKPLRILSTVSTHTTFLKHSMRDAKRAFEALGHRCEILTESTSYEVVGPLTYHQIIREFDPDLFFVLDHLRPEFGSIVPANLPVMTWDQDALPGVFVPERVRAMSPLDTIVGLPHTESLLRAGRDPRQSFFSRMPTCPQQFDASDLSADDLAPYLCDVSYVSHASQTVEAFHAEQYEATKDESVRRVLDALYPIACASLPPGALGPTPPYRDMLTLAQQQAGVSRLDEAVCDHLLNWYLWRLGDRLFRHQALEWVGRWANDRGRTFRIYGNGWDKHPTLAPYAVGPVENGRALLCVYRGTAINLQLMPAGFIHQRALDGLAARGFFMARATRCDVRSPQLAPLLARIRELGLTSGSALLACGDESLVQVFSSYFLDRKDMTARQADASFRRLFQDVVMDYPDEVFPRFAEVTFRDAESFATTAERFLCDPELRSSIVDSMRNVVLEQYSYQETMLRFLRFAGGYFSTLTTESSDCAGVMVE